MYLLFDISIIDYYDHINHILNKKEENKKRKELSLSQEIKKKTLTDLLKKVSLAIETNADILDLIQDHTPLLLCLITM